MSEPRQPRIDTLMVDIGQVMVGLNVQGALRGILPYTPLEASQIRARLAGHPLIVEYETGRVSTEEFHKRFCQLVELDLSLERFSLAWEGIFDFLDEPGRYLSPQLFRQLKGRYRLAALSNTNPLHFAHLQKKLPLVNEFDDYVLSHEAGFVKPEKAIFLAALERLRRTPREVFFIDDLKENVEAAKSLGIGAVVFENESQLRRDLSGLGLLG